MKGGEGDNIFFFSNRSDLAGDSSAVNSILGSMDVSKLCRKYFLSLKKSLFRSFLYLVEVISLILIVGVALLCQVTGLLHIASYIPLFFFKVEDENSYFFLAPYLVHFLWEKKLLDRKEMHFRDAFRNHCYFSRNNSLLVRYTFRFAWYKDISLLATNPFHQKKTLAEG